MNFSILDIYEDLDYVFVTFSDNFVKFTVKHSHGFLYWVQLKIADKDFVNLLKFTQQKQILNMLKHIWKYAMVYVW